MAQRGLRHVNQMTIAPYVGIGMVINRNDMKIYAVSSVVGTSRRTSSS